MGVEKISQVCFHPNMTRHVSPSQALLFLPLASLFVVVIIVVVVVVVVDVVVKYFQTLQVKKFGVKSFFARNK